MIITIDGPAASGKSSVARGVAVRYNYFYLNSGMFFRALAFLLVHYEGYDADQCTAPSADLVEYYLNHNRLVYYYQSGEREKILYEQSDITPSLTSALIDQFSSLVAQDSYVRKYICMRQRTLVAAGRSSIIDGRDAGTFAFPRADYKFFITASLDERARRYVAQQAGKGIAVSFEQARRHIAQRDERDRERVTAPLQVPADARVIDTTGHSVEEVITWIADSIGKDHDDGIE